MQNGMTVLSENELRQLYAKRVTCSIAMKSRCAAADTGIARGCRGAPPPGEELKNCGGLI